VGTETSLRITGDRLEDFEKLLFYTPGIEMTSVEKVEAKAVEIKIKIAADVQPGNHLMRVVTKSGISHGKQFMVGHYDHISEVEPNNDLESAQAIELNHTIEGVIQSEDVDYFKVSLKKGQHIALEAEGLRMGYGTFDPFLAILDENRFEKVVVDDSILHRQDGFCTWEADEDGDYYIMIRDSSYRGSSTAFYRLHVGDFRRPVVVYPGGGKAGEVTKVKFIEQSEASFEEEVTVPTDRGNQILLFSKTQPPAPSGNPFRISDMPNVLEVEPNNDIASATDAGVGGVAAINGIIDQPGDVDFFKVSLKKGQKIVLQGYGQALGAPIDMVVNLQNAKGGNISGNDDGGGTRRLDSKATIDIPEDGDYYVRVTDHLERGGPTFVYRVEITPPAKELFVSSPNFNINDSHYRQFIAVPKGGRFATLVNATRSGVSGDFKFAMEGLPAGVKLLTDTLPGNYSGVPLLFEAAADAPLGSAAVPLSLSSVDPAQTALGKLRQPFDVVRLGNVIFLTETHDTLPVAVVEEVPFDLEIVKPSAPLPTGGVMDLKVVAKRKEGFTGKIRVLMIWKPAGISSLGEVTIGENENECVFVLDAKADAPIGKWNFTVLGEVDAGNGRIYNASPFMEVETVPAFMSAPTMDLAAVEQGQETQMLAKLEILHPFEGEATATIIGIPDSIQIAPVKITKDSKEALFKVKTTDQSPVSKQSNLFVKVEVPVGGGQAIHRIATGSTLRIDAPRKAAPEPAAVAAAPAKEAAPAAPKPLSRLEQLRQEAAAAANP
jgi:hypothetical protein